jgi:Tfp pilus assembly protein PilV
MVNAKRMRGMSTLEIVIAFAILTISLTALVSVVFGNQSVSVDTETNTEALGKARALIEKERALAAADFLSASSTATTTEQSQGLSYDESVTIYDITECKKQAKINVDWATTTLRMQHIELTTFLTSTAIALGLGGDCPVDGPTGWQPPQELGFWNSIAATGLDVYKKVVYLSLKKTNPLSSDDLAILNASSYPPVVLKTTDIDNNPGFNAIDVASSTDGHIYAYIANNLTGFGELQIIDVTNPASPVRISSTTLPFASTAVARSIYYYDMRIYIGTQYLACVSCAPEKNNELHIYDVSNPALPVWKASIKVNRNVNEIFVINHIGYFATGAGSGSNTPFYIYDLNPNSSTYLQKLGSFATAGSEQGTSVYVIGNTAYLGLERTPSSRPDFFKLNISKPNSISISASANLSLNPSSAVTGIRIVGNLAFIGVSDPNTGFEVRDINNLGTVYGGPFNFQQNTSDIDYENNIIYLSALSGSKTLEILGAGP